MLKSFPVAYRTRQCDMLSVPESTSFTWRLGVKTAPEKPRFIIVGFLHTFPSYADINLDCCSLIHEEYTIISSFQNLGSQPSWDYCVCVLESCI